MRKIIEASPVSVDGVVGDAQLWAMDYRDEEVQQEALDRLASADAMLMGRGTYEVFAATWPGQSGAFDRPDERHPQVRLLLHPRPGQLGKLTIISGDVVTEATRLRQQAAAGGPWLSGRRRRSAGHHGGGRPDPGRRCAGSVRGRAGSRAHIGGYLKRSARSPVGAGVLRR